MKLSKKSFFSLLLVILLVLGFLYSSSLSKPKFDEQLSDDIFSKIEVAPLDDAITLAVTSAGEVLLVRDATAKGVAAINLNTINGEKYRDAVDAYNGLGRDGLLQIASSTLSREYLWDDLSVPVIVEDKIVAAGTNFLSHMQEVNLEGGEPFLFPKLSNTTSWNAGVKDGARLDHEVELCAVPLQDFRSGDKTPLAFLLCGDFTDRWLLVKDIDLDGEMGKTGFPLGKGGETRLPVGPFLVVPSSHDFYKDVEMKLYVNQDLRQHSKAGLMIWDPWQMMQKTLEDCDSIYTNLDQAVRILDGCEKIPAKTLLLTGTPEGTMFNIATLWNPSFYLTRGDVVTAYAKHLGVTKNIVQ